uniref:Uncharacterized protein n=1 Tax=Nelumbo nucifera TaxID=4432 RepID=A0A822ZBJ7_NELNU|nr:TPA_asm: hypothetical protein HUJ06_014739 [Nelumbo nucifera]
MKYHDEARWIHGFGKKEIVSVPAPFLWSGERPTRQIGRISSGMTRSYTNSFYSLGPQGWSEDDQLCKRPFGFLSFPILIYLVRLSPFQRGNSKL